MACPPALIQRDPSVVFFDTAAEIDDVARLDPGTLVVARDTGEVFAVQLADDGCSRELLALIGAAGPSGPCDCPTGPTGPAGSVDDAATQSMNFSGRVPPQSTNLDGYIANGGDALVFDRPVGFPALITSTRQSLGIHFDQVPPELVPGNGQVVVTVDDVDAIVVPVFGPATTLLLDPTIGIARGSRIDVRLDTFVATTTPWQVAVTLLLRP